MKSLLKLMKRKERRWSEETKKGLERRTSRGGRHKQAVLDASTSNTVDESFSSTLSEVAPWRVENILVAGPPSESDWWEDVLESASDYDSSSDMSSYDSVEEYLNSRSRRRYRGGDRGGVVGTRGKQQRFRNIGLQTWRLVQEAWRVPAPGASSNTTPSYPSKSARRDIRRGISRNRCYDLKKRVALGDIIEIYNEMWNEDE